MADFRAIYHLGWREALSLPGPEFFALAWRASAYPGVCAARIAEHRASPRVASTREAILADPDLASVISFN